MNDENYDRLLAAVTVLELAVIEIGMSLPSERRQALSARMKELRDAASDNPYGLSIQETADRVGLGLSEPS